MGIQRNGAYALTKEEMRQQSEEAIAQYLANGGKIQVAPTHSRTYGEMRFKSAQRQYEAEHYVEAKPIDFQAEAASLYSSSKQRAERLKEYRAKRLAKEEAAWPEDVAHTKEVYNPWR